MTSPIVGMMIQSDFHIFAGGVGQPPIRIYNIYWFLWISEWINIRSVHYLSMDYPLLGSYHLLRGPMMIRLEVARSGELCVVGL